MDGEIILIDKPTGMTSFGVVARVRRVLSQRAGKKVKVGHCGTLDPFATGLLILVSGKMTRKAMEYTKLDKVYEATIFLGKASTTGDPEGELTDISDIVPTAAQVEEALSAFHGEITQTPPIFSAIKINGQRAYKLAREGKEVEIPERKVTIFSLQLVEYNYPTLKVRAHVSSGTYIRSLAVDIGEKLHTGAYCIELRRTKIADFDVANAVNLASFGVID